MINSSRLAFGDKVRIRTNSSTERLGIANRTVVVCGFTRRSQTGVKIIGDTLDDCAVTVTIEGETEPLWLAENLLEFVNHQPGMTVKIGDRCFVRDARGEWEETNSQ
jgi:hypothetical protein